MSAPDLLFELGTEELPPRGLPGLSLALEEGLLQGLARAGVSHGAAHRFATPRRLAVRVEACAEFVPGRQTERRGPPVAAAFDPQGAPTQAASAFARSCGVDVMQLGRLSTEKGEWLAFRSTGPGSDTRLLLPAIVAEAVAALPMPKRMRWGAHAEEFVRPVRTIVLLFGADVVPARVLGLESNRFTLGHRFHAPRPLAIRSPATYERQLRRACVIADFGQRRDAIREGVNEAAAAAGGRALVDEPLLDEVTGLVEWPVPVVGHFEERFLALPREVVIATIRDHQRYFGVEDPGGRLTGAFVTVSNIRSKQPDVVREGNERVVRPRLSDAAFFWEQDRRVGLDAYAARLADVTFQARLGTYADKTSRIATLALELGACISAGEHVQRAAALCKADLMSSMVGEFPELQGIMGKYYAQAQGEVPDVALACEEHYRPRFAGDALPATKIGQALALADKIDTVVGIFAIEQRPAGTRDPFGLRRAALGILRILLEGRLDLDLSHFVRRAAAAQPVVREGVAAEVEAFIAERLRGLLMERGRGYSAEMIDAVLAKHPGSPLDAEARLLALEEFLRLPEAAALTAVNKRIANLLRKAPPGEDAVPVAALAEPAEIALHEAVARVDAPLQRAVAGRAYADALRAVTTLHTAVDAFFEQVMVMDEDATRRRNRLGLLRDVQSLLGAVADLSRLPG